MKLRTCLIIISAVCCSDIYARVHKELTKDQLIRMLRRIPVPEICNKPQTQDLLFATLIIDGDIFDLICKEIHEIYFYACTLLSNLDGSKEEWMIKVVYNTTKQTLKYGKIPGQVGEFLDDKNYELEPVETPYARLGVQYLTDWPIITYQNKVAPQTLKRNLDRIWSFLKQHCQNKRPDSKHLIIVTINGVKIPANFDCALQKVQIQEAELAGQAYRLVNTEGSSDGFRYDYSLETGEFSSPTPWGVLQIQPDPSLSVNLRDNDDPITLEEIRFPLQIFEKDLHDIRNEMSESRNSQTDVAKSKSKPTLEERQKIISKGSGGVVVNGEVLMEIKRYTTKKAKGGDAKGGDAKGGDAKGGDASVIKIHARTFAPHKEVYLSQTGFKKTSFLMGWNTLENIQDYYVKGKFFKEWPEYSSEYADMRFLRDVLTESLEESKQNKNENCIQTAYFVYQKRMSLQTKMDVCQRIIEVQNLEVLRLKRAAGGLEAFKTLYDLVYFMEKDFTTKDGALEDALSVRLKPFHESSCTECFLMHRDNIDPDDWTIYLSGSSQRPPDN